MELEEKALVTPEGKDYPQDSRRQRINNVAAENLNQGEGKEPVPKKGEPRAKTIENGGHRGITGQISIK